MTKPQTEEKQQIDSLYNVVDWSFNEHQFKGDTDFKNPGIDEKYVLRAIADGFLKTK